MAADDRDWYRERAKKTMRDHYYSPKLFRGGGNGGRSSGGLAFRWGIAAVLLVIAVIEWNSRGMNIYRLASSVQEIWPENLQEPVLVVEQHIRGGKAVRSAHMLVGKDRKGQYATKGSIDGVPVYIAINRAESRTLVPIDLMKPDMTTSCFELGSPASSAHRTACHGYADAMVFGVFALPRIPVIFIPGIGGKIQLGMDVLASFDIEQAGSKMLIRSNSPQSENKGGG